MGINEDHKLQWLEHKQGKEGIKMKMKTTISFYDKGNKVVS